MIGLDVGQKHDRGHIDLNQLRQKPLYLLYSILSGFLVERRESGREGGRTYLIVAHSLHGRGKFETMATTVTT